MLIETIPTTLLQIFYKNILYSWSFINCITDPIQQYLKELLTMNGVQKKRKLHSPGTSEYESEFSFPVVVTSEISPYYTFSSCFSLMEDFERSLPLSDLVSGWDLRRFSQLWSISRQDRKQGIIADAISFLFRILMRSYQVSLAKGSTGKCILLF